MAKSTNAASKASKAPAKATKASSNAAKTSGSGAGKSAKATKASGKRPAQAAAKSARPKRLAPGANAQLRRIDDLSVEVAERLDHLRSRYLELEEIEPDVGAGEDEGGASFDAGLVERDQIRSMIADEELILQRLGDAAERVRAGTWRTCRVCGGDIGEARLEALPGTDLCVSCKAAGH